MCVSSSWLDLIGNVMAWPWDAAIYLSYRVIGTFGDTRASRSCKTIKLTSQVFFPPEIHPIQSAPGT